MFGVYTRNLLDSYQVQGQRVIKPSAETQAISFFIGQALQLSLFTFSLAQKSHQKQMRDQNQDKGVVKPEIVLISDEQIEVKSKNSKGKKKHEKSEEDAISHQQLSTSNFTEGQSPQNCFQEASGRNSAENLNNTPRLQNKIISQASEIQRECDKDQFSDDLGLAEVPELTISIEDIQQKRNQLLMRQVTNWKHTSKKQKGQLKRLKI